ncbi:MAG: DNA-binding domain-containing protein [Paludibacter sp.]|nr:DNA-binding domain-containing protein [Paludibacter sp.]
MKKILNAWLRKNLLTSDPNDYTAIVQVNGSMGISQIVDEMIEQGTELKRETIINIITRVNSIAADMVLSGYNVNTGLVYMRPVIKGVFSDKTFDHNLHQVYIAMNQGYDLSNAVAETEVNILGEQSDIIELLSVTDLVTGKTDGTLTKGRNAELKGSYLKIAGDNQACGIVFRNLNTQAETRLETADIVLNEPSRLLILVPAALEAGQYELQVTTQYSGGGKNLQAPRSVVFGSPIEIA